MGNCVWWREPKSSQRARAAREEKVARADRIVRVAPVRVGGAMAEGIRTQVIKMEVIESRRDEIFIARALNGSRSSDRKTTRLNSSHQIISHAVFSFKTK